MKHVWTRDSEERQRCDGTGAKRGKSCKRDGKAEASSHVQFTSCS